VADDDASHRDGPDGTDRRDGRGDGDGDGDGGGGGGGDRGSDGAQPTPPIVNRVLRLAENAVYLGLSFVLICAALLMLGQGAYDLATSIGEGVGPAVRDVLDTLLLVFILVELLSATRETMNERRIVAEPFLLVGIIASIKEVVVLAIGAKEDLGKDKEAFESAMLGIGTISGLLLVLSVAILLVRRKEREPEED
jgi:uncharacterized membrane protein (DUF373 family)